jgi:superoxide reductase
MGDLFQSADWKTEKHVPVIECADSVTKGEMFDVTVSLGKEVAHPNTTEHHIRWIRVYFKPEGDKFVYEVGSFEFNAHGEAVSGPNEGPVYTNHTISFQMKTDKSGTLLASAYCNIHGLWEYSREISL